MRASSLVQMLLSLTTIVVLSPCAAAAADPVVVTSCNQIAAGDAVLGGDLDCSGSGGPALVMTTASTLDLAGYTITGDASANAAVLCQVSCRLIGPGTIDANDSAGVRTASELGKVSVEGVTVRDGRIGILARRVTLESASILDNDLEGVRAAHVVARDTIITGNGLLGGLGVRAARAGKLTGCTVTGNGIGGIEGGRIGVRGSTVTGNDQHPTCGASVCVDIAASVMLRVSGSDCDTSLSTTSCGCYPGSAMTPENPPEDHDFGVCTLDD